MCLKHRRAFYVGATYEAASIGGIEATEGTTLEVVEAVGKELVANGSAVKVDGGDQRLERRDSAMLSKQTRPGLYGG